MKLIVNKKRLNLNPEAFLRRAGYAFIHDERTGKDSFVRRFTRDFYPRFHMYFEDRSDRVIFNLHLDQKRASYQGSHMHNAEYEGEAVENEMERLKGFLIAESRDNFSLEMPEVENKTITHPASQPSPAFGHPSQEGNSAPLSRGELHGKLEDAPKVTKKSWFRRIFG